MSTEIHFVLNGLLNGDEELPAVNMMGATEKDGWYFTDDNSLRYPDAYGPYKSKAEAERGTIFATTQDALEDALGDLGDALAAVKNNERDNTVHHLKDVMKTIQEILDYL